MTAYGQFGRVRDSVDRVVHLRDPDKSTLSVCMSGFAKSTLEVDWVNNIDDLVPTCLWCIAGSVSNLPHWRLIPEDDPRRTVIGTYTQQDGVIHTEKVP